MIDLPAIDVFVNFDLHHVPHELSCSLELSILFSPCTWVLTLSPYFVVVAILNVALITDDSQLLSELLLIIKALLIESLYLGILVAIEVHPVVDFIGTVFVIVIEVVDFVSPPRDVHGLSVLELCTRQENLSILIHEVLLLLLSS